MSRVRLVLASLASAALVATIAPLTHADPPLHTCEGQVDYACLDRSGAFCTVYLNWRCELGA
jgi:hypothetical protein